MKKSYGNQKTHLTLTPKAQKCYNNTDVRIYEHEEYANDNWDDLTTVYTYTMKWYGEDESEPMTAEELNADLEVLQDEFDRQEAEWKEENNA